MPRSFKTALVLAVALLGSTARAAEVHVAVASNFASTMQSLAGEFEKKTGHRALLSSAATGKLYAQISNGAPFDVFLAADEKTPAALEADGLALPGSRFTYALGRLALFSAKPGYVDAQAAVLRSGGFQHLAIANPKLAPYGAAALAALAKLGVLSAVRPKLVHGENIAQALQFVVSGNAELGFVAWSQLLVNGKPRAGSFWLVPEALYPPIRQDAVLLRRAAKSSAAAALLEFLKSDSAARSLASYGYALPAKAAAPRHEP